MITLSKCIADNTVTATCNPAQREQAQWFVDMLAEMATRGVQLREGLTVCTWFSELTLRRRGDALALTEPDFQSDPLTRSRDDVSFSLALQGRQMSLLQQCGVKPIGCDFRSRVSIAAGCLSEPRVTMFRTAPQFESDSGWRFFATGASGASGNGVVSAYELVEQRAALLDALALPVDWMAQFEGDVLVGIGRPPK